MVHFTLPVASALLALVSLGRAKKQDGIMLYPFVTEACLGDPMGAPVYIERDQCVETQANSVKPMVHVVRNWIEKTNRQEEECQVITYKAKGCMQGDEIEAASVPKMLSQCLMSLEPDTPIFSTKFICFKKDLAEDDGLVTSWSIGGDDKPTPHVSTHAIAEPTLTQNAKVMATPGPLAERDDPAVNPSVDVMSVWMLHPWSKSLLCYQCYTYEKKSFNEFDCRSGPRNVGHCGPRPPSINGEPIPVETKSPGPMESEVPATGRLSKRWSWHKPVYFISPFVPGLVVCADAEWEKRGQPESEIRLQKISPCGMHIILGDNIGIPM